MKPDQPRAAVADRATVGLTAVAVALGALLAIVVFLVIGGAAPTATATGLQDAGPVVGWLLPVSRLAMDLAAIGTVGCVVFAACLVPAEGVDLRPGARRALRAGSWWALAWAVTAAIGSMLTLADISGLPLLELVRSADVAVSLVTVGQSRSLLIVVALATLVSWCARRVSAAEGTLPVLLLAAGTLIPPILTGHASSHSNAELATVSLIVHVVAASAWVGGLGAVLLFGRTPAVDEVVTVTRFSVLAVGCFLATALSGLINAWVQLAYGAGALTELLASGYGWLVLGKMAALAALAGFGWWHRRHTLVELTAGRPRAFRRFAGRELLVMIGTVAMAVALSRTPTPTPVPPLSTVDAPSFSLGLSR